ncbi:hypothetical protein GCM10022198_14940 [Klugiella xanthotipulae]
MIEQRGFTGSGAAGNKDVLASVLDPVEDDLLLGAQRDLGHPLSLRLVLALDPINSTDPHGSHGQQWRKPRVSPVRG